jgi:hypothetical protein
MRFSITGPVSSRWASLPTQRAVASSESASRFATVVAAVCSFRLRRPNERHAQLTPFFWACLEKMDTNSGGFDVV